MRAPTRLRAVVLTVAVLVTLVSGTAVGASADDPSPPVPSTQSFDLTSPVVCAGTPHAGTPAAGDLLRLSGTATVSGTAPRSVAPGGDVEVRARLALTLDTDLEWHALRLTMLVGPNAGWQQPFHNFVPSDDDFSLQFHAGVTGPLILGYANGDTVHLVAATADGTIVDMRCDVPQGGPSLSIAVVMPTDGSLQTFDASASADCTTDEGGSYTHTFALHGVAPAQLRAGDPVSVTFDYQGLASLLAEWLTLSVTGTDTAQVEVPTISGAQGQRVSLGQAGEGPGFVDVRFGVVRSSLQGMNPPHVITARCTFTEPRLALRIPIAPKSPPHTTPDTTPGTTPGTMHRSAWAAILRLICRLLRAC
jgi:hypothetical protein